MDFESMCPGVESVRNVFSPKKWGELDYNPCAMQERQESRGVTETSEQGRAGLGGGHARSSGWDRTPNIRDKKKDRFWAGIAEGMAKAEEAERQQRCWPSDSKADPIRFGKSTFSKSEAKARDAMRAQAEKDKLKQRAGGGGGGIGCGRFDGGDLGWSSDDGDDLEKAGAAADDGTPLKVGDKVRVKPTVVKPKHGWGTVSHQITPGELRAAMEQDGNYTPEMIETQMRWIEATFSEIPKVEYP